LVKRAKDPEKGRWCLPGGYLNWDETVEECAIREFLEETGYEISNLNMVGVYSNPDRDDGRQTVVICFSGDIERKNGHSDSEVIEVRLMSKNEIPRLAFDHNKLIEDYYEGRSHREV